MNPPCFSSQDEYDKWLELARQTGLESPEDNFCFDCNPIFKTYALAQGLCTRPRTFFLQTKDEDGEDFVFGVSVVE